MTALSVYIGYDPREDEAYRVCRASLLRRSSRDLHITALDLGAVRHNGWYRRRWHESGNDRIDDLDGKPFSTEFSFSRFLVPALSLYQGWSLYCDCDFLFLADVCELFHLADHRYAVMCVQHHHDPQEKIKMTGLTQTKYYRKNWSSLVLWNCAHPANRRLTTNHINTFPGSWLHSFQWLEDDEIGALPRTWNFLAGISAPLDHEHTPAGIHYTLGTPNLPGYENSPYADLWYAERDSRRAPGRPNPTERLRAIA